MPQKAIKEIKRILWGDNEDLDIDFDTMKTSFVEGSIMDWQGVEIECLENGTNDKGEDYITLLLNMPKGTGFPKNLHSDAYEMFYTIKGVIKETIIPIEMKSCRLHRIRPGTVHAFEALTDAIALCHIYRVEL